MIDAIEIARRAEQRKRAQEPTTQSAPAATPPTTRQYPLQGLTKTLPLEK